MTPRGAIVVTLLAFVGCSALSPQADRTRYFVLRPLAVPERQPVSGGTSYSIGIGPVVVPDHLEHGLVTRLSGDEITISDTDRWAEPLHELVSHALRQNLTALLHTERMRAYPWELSEAPDLAVTVEILHFERTARRTVDLAARWTIERGSDRTALATEETRVSKSLAAPGSGDAAAALSSALVVLSRNIAQALRRVPPKSP